VSGLIFLPLPITSDDDRAGFKTKALHCYLANDPELTVRYKYDPLSATHVAGTSYRLTIGFTNSVSSAYGDDTEQSLTSRAGFLWYKTTDQTTIQVCRNDADGTQDLDGTVSLAQTDSSVHTIRLFGDNTNSRWGVSLDGANATYFTTEIPTTQRLGVIVQWENEGSDDRSFELYGAHFKATVI
jgi:hypothetical protein